MEMLAELRYAPVGSDMVPERVDRREGCWGHGGHTDRCAEAKLAEDSRIAAHKYTQTFLKFTGTLLFISQEFACAFVRSESPRGVDLKSPTVLRQKTLVRLFGLYTTK